jgi:hypothetical protein
MHTTEQHRRKRPFQPTITTFFAARLDLDWDADERGQGPTSRPRTTQYHTSTCPRDTLAPAVPGQIQADLLSVGMRVRKSVPEGYRTHKMSALLSIQTTLSSPALDVKHPPSNPVPDDFLRQRELLPFCGLHTVGGGGFGFAEQPTTNIHLYAGVDATGSRPTNMFPLPAEAFSQPFSTQSQSSTDSGYGSETPRSHPSKRSWSDEDGGSGLDISGSNFFFAIPMKGTVEVDEVPVSPLSETPPRGINMLPPVRQLAQPKSRRPVMRSMHTDSSMDSMEMDVENEEVDGRRYASDFDEADFLEMGEVDMGGM